MSAESLVQKNPKITRTAFQRLYDMLISYGTEEYQEYKEKLSICYAAWG